ncbi:MAG: flagellar protein [Lachnospiraceae bacterium]|nr:flagellar protein [Lachnospiraceae bacterium]
MNSGRNQAADNAVSFQKLLDQKAEEADAGEQVLKFSKHAAGRLEERNIELSQTQLERLQEGTLRAGEKGINESLVLMDQLAFIVNIPGNTVITAMDQTETEQNIFTNIDGAVIV